MKVVRIAPAIFLASISCIAAHIQPSSKHLLLDTSTINAAHGTKLVPGEAVKHEANPLLSDGNSEQLKPWEVRYDNMQPNVFLDQGKYKLWYSSWTTCEASDSTRGTAGDACSTKGYWPCSGIIAPRLGPKGRIPALMYAESPDGIVWNKPALGIVTDSKTTTNTTNFTQNNIVLLANDGTGVLIDHYAANLSQRYKLFGAINSAEQKGPGTNNQAFAASADGIHWPPSDFGGSSAALDRHGTHNNMVYDPVSKRFYGYGRNSNSPFRTESVARSATSDFLGKWEAAIPCGLEKDEDLEYQPDAMVVMSEPYHGVWLGLANMLNVTNAPYAGTTEVELVWSKDLMNWKYVAHKVPFIPRGPPKSYDCCQIFGAKQAPVIVGETMKVFYAGGNGPFMGSRSAGFSLATFQRDWWFGHTPSNTSAPKGTWAASVLTTEVIVGTAAQLRVSADARRGAVAVAVVGYPALSAANCDPLRGNLTEGLVTWQGQGGSRQLGALVGKNITLQFLLQPGAVLFAFDV
jgi:hypothetical protein